MKKPNNKIGSFVQVGSVLADLFAELGVNEKAGAEALNAPAVDRPYSTVLAGRRGAGGGSSGMETVMRLSEALPPIRGPQRVASLTLMTVTHPAFPWLERGAGGIWLGHPLGSV
jgi:hypothetical protein